MNKVDFKKDFGKDELNKIWQSGFGDLFFVEGKQNEIFDNKITCNEKSIETVTGFKNIETLNALFENIDNRSELILSEGLSSFINTLKFKLLNGTEVGYVPLIAEKVYSIRFFHYPDKGFIIFSLMEATDFFNFINEYLEIAYRNPISGLFNMNMYQKHLLQIESNVDTYVAVYHLQNFYSELHVIDKEKIKNVVKAISKLLYDETYSKVCVYHLKDNEYVVKATDMTYEKASKLFEHINTKIRDLVVNGYKPDTCLGYVKFDTSICDNLETGRFAYLSVILASQAETKICALSKTDIQEYIQKYGNALQTAIDLGLKDY